MHSYIQAGIGLAGGATVGPKGIVFGVIIGGTSGAITGTIIYIRSINSAKAALKAAKERLEHAKTALENAKSVPPYVTITPLKSHISIYYTPTHTIDISSNIAIKEVQVKITPSD